MIESDLKNELETVVPSVSVYPVKIPEESNLPAILYKNISGVRDNQSSLSKNEIRNSRFQITMISKSPSDLFNMEQTIYQHFENFAGTMGSTIIFSCVITGGMDNYNSAQEIYEKSIDLQIRYKKVKFR